MTPLLITNPYNIFYLSSFPSFNLEEREAYLLIAKNNNFLLTDGRYLSIAKKLKDFKTLEITPQKKLTFYLKDILKRERSLGIEEHDLKVEEYHKLKKNIKARLLKTKQIIEKLREIKSTKEIDKIKKAAKMTDQAFSYIKTQIRKGITEKDLALNLTTFIKNQGGELAFLPIIAFGKNSAIPHYQTGDTKLKKGDVILLDFGAKIDNYCSDITRVLFFKTVTPKQKEIYNAALKAQNEAIKTIKPGIKAKEIDKAAKKIIKTSCFPPYKHSLGHGIGLQAHEKPSISIKSKDNLEKGMVFSIEPGIYLPELGGIRIEDLVYISENGPEILTKASKKLTIID